MPPFSPSASLVGTGEHKGPSVEESPLVTEMVCACGVGETRSEFMPMKHLQN